jgi:hypothetical protein
VAKKWASSNYPSFGDGKRRKEKSSLPLLRILRWGKTNGKRVYYVYLTNKWHRFDWFKMISHRVMGARYWTSQFAGFWYRFNYLYIYIRLYSWTLFLVGMKSCFFVGKNLSNPTSQRCGLKWESIPKNEMWRQLTNPTNDQVHLRCCWVFIKHWGLSSTTPITMTTAENVVRNNPTNWCILVCWA